MCGLIYYENVLTDSVLKSIRKRYNAQRTRGTNGFGFVSFDITDRIIKGATRTEEEKDIMEELEKAGGNAVLFHHRIPTSTPNLKDANHPIKVENRRLKHTYYVAHNGVLTNEDELKKKHEELGYTYTTEIKIKTVYETASMIYTQEESSKFNDSEALAIELAELIEGRQNKCEARGSIAFLVLQVKGDKVLNLYYGRNDGNPLKCSVHKGIFSLTSEGAGSEVKPDMLFKRSLEDGKTEAQDVKFRRYMSDSYEPSKARDLWNNRNKEEKEEKKELIVWPENYQEVSSIELATDMRLSDYEKKGNKITDFATEELISYGYDLDSVLTWLEDDLKMLQEIEFNSEALGLKDDLCDCIEIMAEIEDRITAVKTALEMENATSHMGFNKE